MLSYCLTNCHCNSCTVLTLNLSVLRFESSQTSEKMLKPFRTHAFEVFQSFLVFWSNNCRILDWIVFKKTVKHLRSSVSGKLLTAFNRYNYFRKTLHLRCLKLQQKNGLWYKMSFIIHKQQITKTVTHQHSFHLPF